MHVEIPDLRNSFYGDLETYSNSEEEEHFESFDVSDSLKENNLLQVLQVQSNVYKVDHVMIVKAPVIAVSTEAGFTFELVTDTGAEVNILSDTVAKELGLRIDKTRTGANQVNKAPLNVKGMVTIDVCHGDFQCIGLLGSWRCLHSRKSFTMPRYNAHASKKVHYDRI